ncbi:MAG: hypothetical protein HFACDABA_02901 [Anaerolineales bacterium]|nr:hypothetical protein [Anaerolineales bacterium]
MKTSPKIILLLAGGLLIASVCVFVIPPLIPDFGANATPTPTPPATKPPTPTLRPKVTPMPSLIVPTDTPTPLPPVPSPFDIALLFTNGSCGAGTPTWYYTFTIEGTSLTQVQTDGIGGAVVVSLTGVYDPVSGAFSTSADVGTGVEEHSGAIRFDGTTITVTGSYGYTPTGGVTCTFTFEGTTTP